MTAPMPAEPQQSAEAEGMKEGSGHTIKAPQSAELVVPNLPVAIPLSDLVMLVGIADDRWLTPEAALWSIRQILASAARAHGAVIPADPWPGFVERDLKERLGPVRNDGSGDGDV
jgi:hypothetical protein